MDKVVTEYKGIKYSLQPHGWKSRLLVWFFSFVVAFGGALAVVSPAEAAPPGSVFVTVCGDDETWYVNGDEAGSDPNQGDRRPKATSDGLVFGPRDLIHHETDFLIMPWTQPGTFVADPEPDLPDFFSIEVWNDNGTGYATIRWNSQLDNWSLTTGGSTFTGSNPKKLLEDRGKSTHARSFGVGYTNTPPGSVTSLVSSLDFLGTSYDLSCPVAPSSSPSPTPVVVSSPSPVVVVVTTMVPVPGTTKVVIQKVPIIPLPDPSGTTSSEEEPSPSTSETNLVPATDTPSGAPLSMSPAGDVPAGDSSGSNSLAPIMVAVAAAIGLGLVGAGVIGAIRRRRYQGAHSSGQESETNNTYDDYNPS